jgi:hypothetical protein
MNAPQSLPGINSVGEAELVIADLGRIMDALLAAIEQETVLVRDGKLSEAERLSAAKSELAGNYLATTERIKASRPFLARSLPEQLAELRRRHDSFHAVLQINLTVLATAHAVSEGIVRGVSDEINRAQVPQTYGASGRATVTRPKNRQPIAVSRSA